jgi:3-deoxy-7-phosphoheptulonate synthase
LDDWSPQSWQSKPGATCIPYPDPAAESAAVDLLRPLPPLVTSWEIERLKTGLAAAQRGESFLLQGGDCAERLPDCRPDAITGKLKILLQMSLVLFHATRRPVIRAGRFAGQYAKPRSSPTETRLGADGPRTLPSYHGDLVNREEFTETARRPDPSLMVQGYMHAALTLNFIRSLVDRGFADLHHPENWDLGMLRRAGLTPELRDKYRRMCAELVAELNRADATGAPDTIQSTRAEFFTTHEGFNLAYESAQTRRVPRREGFYTLTTHLPWIGDRSRALDGAHVEFFRGIRNPVGVKLGPGIRVEDAVRLCERLNPGREPGKLVLITRLGVEAVERVLGGLVEALAREGWVSQLPAGGAAGPVLWSCDPMHGNTFTAGNGGSGMVRKTRRFEDILRELELCWDIHQSLGSRLGGVHVELTHEDVTECLGGAAGITESDLGRNYTSACDPRLNYDQAMELAFLLGEKMGRGQARV